MQLAKATANTTSLNAFTNQPTGCIHFASPAEAAWCLEAKPLLMMMVNDDGEWWWWWWWIMMMKMMMNKDDGDWWWWWWWWWIWRWWIQKSKDRSPCYLLKRCQHHGVTSLIWCNVMSLSIASLRVVGCPLRHNLWLGVGGLLGSSSGIRPVAAFGTKTREPFLGHLLDLGQHINWEIAICWISVFSCSINLGKNPQMQVGRGWTAY